MPLNISDTYTATKHCFAFALNTPDFHDGGYRSSTEELISCSFPVLWFKNVKGAVTVGAGKAGGLMPKFDASGNLLEGDNLYAAARQFALTHRPNMFGVTTYFTWNGETFFDALSASRMKPIEAEAKQAELAGYLDEFLSFPKKERRAPAGYEGWYEVDRKTYPTPVAQTAPAERL